jgi:hypothetical protein
VATLRHSVLDRRYLVSLFTFKEKTPVPSRRSQQGLDGHYFRLPIPVSVPVPPSKIRLLSPGQIARHPHGGLLLKVLAAWRGHGR